MVLAVIPVRQHIDGKIEQSAKMKQGVYQINPVQKAFRSEFLHTRMEDVCVERTLACKTSDNTKGCRLTRNTYSRTRLEVRASDNLS